MISRLIGSPRPVPAGRFRVGVAALTELLEDDALVRGGDARSVVLHVDPHGAVLDLQTEPHPSRGRDRQNFTALDSRLTTTCTTRSRSASTAGTALGQV